MYVKYMYEYYILIYKCMYVIFTPSKYPKLESRVHQQNRSNCKRIKQ